MITKKEIEMWLVYFAFILHRTYSVFTTRLIINILMFEDSDQMTTITSANYYWNTQHSKFKLIGNNRMSWNIVL